MTRRNAQGGNPASVPPRELEFKTTVYLQMLTYYLFCRFQEIMQVITETLFHIIVCQTLKLKTSMS